MLCATPVHFPWGFESWPSPNPDAMLASGGQKTLVHCLQSLQELVRIHEVGEAPHLPPIRVNQKNSR